jgi:hypothetical protein
MDPIKGKPATGAGDLEVLRWADDGTALEPVAGQRNSGWQPYGIGPPPDYRILNYFAEKTEDWIRRLAGSALIAERAIAAFTVGGAVDAGDQRDTTIDGVLLSYVTTTETLNSEIATGIAAQINADATLRERCTAEASGDVVFVAWSDPGVTFAIAAAVAVDAGAASTYVASGPSTPIVRSADDGPGFDLDLVFGSPQADDDGNAAHDARIVWRKALGAFRAGRWAGTDADLANVGDQSAAFGTAKASGADSFAAGSSTASGASSSALGSLSTASGAGSFAGGDSNVASGEASTALGQQSLASGDNSFAAINGESSGIGSFAAGLAALASGDGAAALGASTASAARAAAFGASTASGADSTASGSSTASASNSTALGSSTASQSEATAFGAATASGIGSTAGGGGLASGDLAFAHGETGAGPVTASGDGAMATGGLSAVNGAVTALGDASRAHGVAVNAAAHYSDASGRGGSATTQGERARAAGTFSAIGFGPEIGASQEGTIHVSGRVTGAASVVMTPDTAGGSPSWDPDNDSAFMVSLRAVARQEQGGVAGNATTWEANFAIEVSLAGVVTLGTIVAVSGGAFVAGGAPLAEFWSTAPGRFTLGVQVSGATTGIEIVLTGTVGGETVRASCALHYTKIAGAI